MPAATYTTAGSTDDTTDDPADTVADDTAGTTAATGDTVSTAPSTTIDPQFVFERPAGLDFTKVESPFAPTPCPDDQPVHACIWLPLVPDDPGTGDLSVYYFTSGFAPELEPAGLHLHFYLDTAVGGDERKAGSEVSGGTWKEWDGPYPFSTFGGQNGRTGFSMADLQASGARQVCVIVADADQRALPGTGKNFEQFRADDMDCRQYAQYQTGGKSADQAAVDAAQSSAYGSQRQYDNAYIQCMYAKGHQVPVPQGQFRSGRYSSGAPATGSYAPPPPPDAPPPASASSHSPCRRL